MPAIALYARVSTSDQTTEPQLHALRQYAALRGGPAEEYVDAGVSGAKDRRPALDQLLADARRRKVSALVVTKLDRLARSTRHLANLGAELEALGVDLVVLDQSIDTGTPAGRLLFNVLGAIAEFERDLIRERVRAGMAAARRAGKPVGRPRAIGPREAARLRELLDAGESDRAIARTLGCGAATVAREAVRLGLRSAA